MSAEAPADIVERQQWLEPVETGLQRAVTVAYGSTGPVGRKIKNFLHGVWLGRPLHPALTDPPLGSWTTALVLDLAEASGARGVSRGVDAALRVGLAGAAGAAIAGLTDRQATDGYQGGPLAEGQLQGDVVQCPWLGSRFCVRDGSVVDGPATHAQPTFELRIHGGKIGSPRQLAGIT